MYLSSLFFEIRRQKFHVDQAPPRIPRDTRFMPKITIQTGRLLLHLTEIVKAQMPPPLL